MYNKLIIHSPFLFPPKKIREERKEREVAKPILNQSIIAQKLFFNKGHDVLMFLSLMK
jgi:hypothetical protein